MKHHEVSSAERSLGTGPKPVPAGSSLKFVYLCVRVLLLTITTTILSANSALLQAQSGAEYATVRAEADEARGHGDAGRAIELYSKAAELDPSVADTWWFLGTLQYGADRFGEARASLTHFLALTPNAAPALALRGLCGYEDGHYQEALEDLQHAIALGAANQPRNAQILGYHEALLLTRLGRFEEATVKYMAFVKQATPNPELAVAVGLAGMRLPLLPREVDPSQVDLITTVGQAGLVVMSGDAAGGANAFAQAFERYPTTANVHYFYGYLLFANHSDDAGAQFEKELVLSPHNAVAESMAAWAAGFEGDYATALPAAQKALADDPSLPMAQLMYARSLVETGKFEQGLPYLQKVLAADPSNLEAHMTLAKAYSELGRKEDAQEERQLCLKMTDPSVRSSAAP